MKKLLSSLLPGAAADARGVQKTKRVNLALQGGGAHGAFTWGVLDHLLSDERLSVEGISGTSAGAVNAALLADGLVRGGRAEAKKRLERALTPLEAIREACVVRFRPIMMTTLAALFGACPLASAASEMARRS